MTFRQVADCLPSELKERFGSSYAVHVFRDDEKGTDVLCAYVSALEALDILREAVADPKNMSAYATRARGDGTAQILYLVELEERVLG